MHDDRRERPVALITGASSGIGEGVARRFASGGYRLVLVARRRERLDQLAKELSAKTDVEVVVTDVTAKDAAERSVAAAMNAFGRLDCLVNNAGAGKWAPVGDTTDEMMDEVIETSLKAPFRFARAALRVMGRDSSIINVGSTFGLVGGLNGGIYCAVKAGLVGLTQALAVDYGPRGIRANLVAPGVVKTEMTQRNWDTEEFKRKNHEMTPFHRVGTVEDVANVIFFLASKEGSYIQAQSIALDGGWSKTKYLSQEARFGERVKPSRDTDSSRG
jgi:NAD(P)-dependent dehydrogenase (short-subunit alcohol dehydrogenase family)